MDFTAVVKTSKTKNLLLFIILFLGWFALCTQFYLMVLNSKKLSVEVFVTFLSYFTILTNLLVTLCCTVLFIGKNSILHRFFSNYNTLTAITVYILIVAIIYNSVLRRLQHLQGLPKQLSEILHVAIPLLFFLYWIMFTPKQNFVWQKAIAWLIYPAAYILYTFIHGEISKFYPYPFTNVSKLGLTKAMVNSLLILLIFFLLSLALIKAGNSMSKKTGNPK